MKTGDSVFVGICNSGEQTLGKAIRPSEFGVIPCSVVLSPLGDSSNRGRSAGTTEFLNLTPVRRHVTISLLDDDVDEANSVGDSAGRRLRKLVKKTISENEIANLENNLEEDPEKSKPKTSGKSCRLLALRKNMRMKLKRVVKDKKVSKKKNEIKSTENHRQTRSSIRLKKMKKKKKKSAPKPQVQSRKKPAAKRYPVIKRYKLPLSETLIAHRKMIRFLKVKARKFTVASVSRDRKCGRTPRNDAFNSRTQRRSSMTKVLLALPRNVSYHHQSRLFRQNKIIVNINPESKNAVKESKKASIDMARKSRADRVDRKIEKNKNGFKKFKRNEKHEIQRRERTNTANDESDCRPCDGTEVSLSPLNREQNGVKSQSHILNSIRPCYINLFRSPSAKKRRTATFTDDENSENAVDENINPEDKMVKATNKTKPSHGNFREYNLKRCSVNLYRTTSSRSEVISKDADHTDLDDGILQLDHQDRNKKESSETKRLENDENMESDDSSEHTSSVELCEEPESPTVARKKSKQMSDEEDTWYDEPTTNTESDSDDTMSDIDDSINSTKTSSKQQKKVTAGTRDWGINLKPCSVRLTDLNAKSQGAVKRKQESSKSNKCYNDNMDIVLQNKSSQNRALLNQALQNQASQNKILTPKLLVSDMAFSSDEESDEEIGRNDSLIAIDNLLVSLQDNEAADSGSDHESPASEMDSSHNLSSSFNASWVTPNKSRDSIDKERDKDDTRVFKDLSDSESSDIIVVDYDSDQSLKETTYNTALPRVKRQELSTRKTPVRGHQNVFKCIDVEHTDRYGIKPCVVWLEKIKHPAV